MVSATAEVAHRLLKNAGQLLFRPRVQDIREQCFEEESLGLAKVIRGRLRMAANGEWKALVEECIKDVELQRLAARASAGRSASSPDHLPDATLQAAAVKSRHGSDKGACQILAGGPPVPPGPETDEKVKELFRTAPPEADEQRELQQALEAAANTRRKVQVNPAHASRCCTRLQLASGPGPSGFRNSYIAVIHAHPQGPTTLAAWSNAWGQGRISPWLADMWTGALVRPFFKANGIDIRPILCAEPLLKYAVGTCIRKVDKLVSAAMGDRQCGAGRRRGTSQEIGEIRAAARLRPQDALVSLDLMNAFGAVQWIDALRAVQSTMPMLGPLLAIQWMTMRLQLWQQDADGGGWHALVIYGSLLQGGLVRNDGRIAASLDIR